MTCDERLSPAPTWRWPALRIAAALTLSLGLSAVAGVSQAANTLEPKTSGFDLNRLPRGKDITMPQPATTFVPIAGRVVLTATDMPQTLSFVPVNLAHGPAKRLKLAIFDANSERVQYVEVSPGTPFLYPLKDLASVTVIPSTPGQPDAGLVLRVESDKPLQVAH